MIKTKPLMRGLASLVLSSLLSLAMAMGQTGPAPWSLHYQQTLITQWHPAFHAPYSGTNSLGPEAEARTSVTATLFFDLRLWSGAELLVNPEMGGGRGLGDVSGVAGFPNGETPRIGAPTPLVTTARLYLKQTVALGGELDTVEDAQNQLRGVLPRRRLTVAIGKFCLADCFDGNRYSHDQRSQYMNWALMDNGAWDYAADTRGYTWGTFLEYADGEWAVRGAMVLEPREANGLTMDTRIGKAYSINLEGERSYTIGTGKGTLRLLLFRNQSDAGDYRQAIAMGGSAPDIVLTRRDGRAKVGAGISIDQELTADLGGFLRAGWNNGTTETWAFTEIDRTLSCGCLLSGNSWSRGEDMVGMAGLLNGLSSEHRDYLAAGGYGFLIGDGRLTYAPETIVETFYSCRVTTWLWATAGYQVVLNPAYNRDRGPVHVFSIRGHVGL